jgi:hypothetical protein
MLAHGGPSVKCAGAAAGFSFRHDSVNWAGEHVPASMRRREETPVYLVIHHAAD